jgi:metal-responsive CopG/Arc/MetJ family transcriptional regulator
MPTIQIVLDAPLLRAADRIARRRKINRSALVRSALREHLDRLRVLELERADREGYERHPEDVREGALWDKVVAWPEE